MALHKEPVWKFLARWSQIRIFFPFLESVVSLGSGFELKKISEPQLTFEKNAYPDLNIDRKSIKYDLIMCKSPILTFLK